MVWSKNLIRRFLATWWLRPAFTTVHATPFCCGVLKGRVSKQEEYPRHRGEPKFGSLVLPTFLGPPVLKDSIFVGARSRLRCWPESFGTFFAQASATSVP